jgi:hypothetical protein
MDTLARRLSRSPRTIQRHLHLLKEKGLVEFVERKRDWHGRFGAYVYRVVHIAAATSRKSAQEVDGRKGRRKKRPTTGHKGRLAPNKGQTKHQQVPPNPQKDRIDGYWCFFGEEPPPGEEEKHRLEADYRRQRAARRRIEGFDWLFG